MTELVRITEVGPRDGLQNEPGVIPTSEKVRLIELCAESGVDEVEVTSFVSPKWVPQLGDAAEVIEGLSTLTRSAAGGPPRPEFSALVPNEKGLEAARRFGAHDGNAGPLRKISVFTAASETFSKRNTNVSIAESLERIRAVQLKAAGTFATRAYVSCAIACPFEGPIAPEKVARVAGDLFEMGFDEIDLGDTIGAGTPETVIAMLAAVHQELLARVHRPIKDARGKMTLHLHDTFGRAEDCVRAALTFGIRSFDGSVAGLGGCPYASTPGKRAPGNIATETLVRTVHSAGYRTSVDLGRLAAAANFATQIVHTARAAAGGAA